jgi:hypothetical protein
MEEERKKTPLSGPTGGPLPKYRLVYIPPLGQHMVTLRLSSGVTVHLSRWPHALQSTHRRLLHLELHSMLGSFSVLQLCADWALRSRVSPALIRLLSQGPITAWQSAEGDDPSTISENWSCQLHYG